MASFDLKEYIEKNRQQAIIIGVAGALVLVLLIYGLMRMTGVVGGDEEAGGLEANNSAPAPFGSAGPPGPPGSMAPGMSPRGPSGMPMPGGPSPGGPPLPGGPMPGGPTPGGPPSAEGSPAPAPESPAPGGGGVQSLDGSTPSGGGLDVNAGGTPVSGKKSVNPNADKPLYKAHSDPFAPPNLMTPEQLRRIQERQRQQREEALMRAQIAQLPSISIWKAKSATPQNPTTGTPEAAAAPVVRRTAGLLYGDRVLGVLETDGKTSVVKPGDVLTSGPDRVKVTRIDRNGIVLKRLDKKAGTIVVPLKGAPEGAGGITAPVGGPPMMPYGGYRGGPPTGPRMPGPPLPEG